MPYGRSPPLGGGGGRSEGAAATAGLDPDSGGIAFREEGDGEATKEWAGEAHDDGSTQGKVVRGGRVPVHFRKRKKSSSRESCCIYLPILPSLHVSSTLSRSC